MPAEPPGFLTVFYVDVVPGMRGQGTLRTCSPPVPRRSSRPEGGNDKPLRADTDVANEPMAAAFERVGWAKFAGRREYVMDLAADRA